MRSRLLALAALSAAVAACSDVAGPENKVNRSTTASGTPASVTISPAVDTVQVGKTIQLAAVAKTAGGSEITSATFYWGITDTNTAKVNRSGQVTGRKVGTVQIVAIAGQVYGKSTVVVRDSSTTPTVQDVTPVASGSLFSGYSPSSSHWQHIRTMMTDFYYGWTSTERDWAGKHYDFAMSGNAGAWKAVNPTVGHIPYGLEWSTLIPGQQGDNLLNVYYYDMKSWYAAHTQYRLEDAFLHVAGAARRDSASRAVVKVWDSNRWLINPADPGARAYQVDRFSRATANTDGVFLDESGSGDMAARIKNVAEFPSLAEYQGPHTSLLAAIKQALGNKTLMLNTAEWRKDWDLANIEAAGATHLENMNNPLSSDMPGRWRWIDGLLASGVTVNLVPLYSSDYMNSHPALYPAGGIYGTSAARLKTWELASYYMTVPGTPDHFLLSLENTWSKPFSTLWLKAQEANVGHPRAARATYRTGTDPIGRSYTVYSRDFDRALVLVRTQQGWSSQSYGNETAVDVPLPTGEQWLPLHADGTLGAPVTSIRLRNSEAAILIKKSTITG